MCWNVGIRLRHHCQTCSCEIMDHGAGNGGAVKTHNMGCNTIKRVIFSVFYGAMVTMDLAKGVLSMAQYKLGLALANAINREYSSIKP